MQEAQAAADQGVAAIGISEDRIIVLSATDEEQPVTQTALVMTLDENTSAFAVEGMRYYSYSYGTTFYGCGGAYRQVNDYQTNCLEYASQIRTPYSSNNAFLSSIDSSSAITTIGMPISFSSLNRSKRFFALDVKFRCFLEDAVEYEYNLAWKLIDVAQMTGIPVRENAACVVGISKSTDQRFEFPSPRNVPLASISQFILQEPPIEPWYYNIRLESAPIFEDWHQILCWKNHIYEGVDFVQLNFMRLPLVRIGDELRRITHREVANLKGFPSDYDLPCNDKRWLYKKLIYSGNLIVIQQIAGMINYTLTSNPWRNQRKERGYRFEQIFGKYLDCIKEKATDTPMSIEYGAKIADLVLDYTLSQGSRTFYFEIKYALSLFIEAELINKKNARGLLAHKISRNLYKYSS